MKNFFITAALAAATIFGANAQTDTTECFQEHWEEQAAEWQQEAIFWKNQAQAANNTADSLQDVLNNQDVVLTHEELQQVLTDNYNDAAAYGYSQGQEDCQEGAAEELSQAQYEAYVYGYEQGQEDCEGTSGMMVVGNGNKVPAAYFDTTGRQINPDFYNGLVIVKYTDGSITKTYINQ